MGVSLVPCILYRGGGALFGVGDNAWVASGGTEVMAGGFRRD